MKIKSQKFAIHINEIRSGGQTGVDRAALDVALRLGLKTGGYVPHGRTAEDGQISDKYPDLTETDSADPNDRTLRNVSSADATMLITNGQPFGGSLYTRQFALKSGKPFLHLELEKLDLTAAAGKAAEWLNEKRVRVLNIAGPRASEDPNIYSRATEFLELLFSAQK